MLVAEWPPKSTDRCTLTRRAHSSANSCAPTHRPTPQSYLLCHRLPASVASLSQALMPLFAPSSRLFWSPGGGSFPLCLHHRPPSHACRVLSHLSACPLLRSVPPLPSPQFLCLSLLLASACPLLLRVGSAARLEHSFADCPCGRACLCCCCAKPSALVLRCAPCFVAPFLFLTFPIQPGPLSPLLSSPPPSRSFPFPSFDKALNGDRRLDRLSILDNATQCVQSTPLRDPDASPAFPLLFMSR